MPSPLLPLLLLLVGCDASKDTADPAPEDPLESALSRVRRVDAPLAEDLASLSRVADGVDEAELAAIEELATVVETVALEDPRAVALLRNLPAAGFVDEASAPSVDGLDDDWSEAPGITKPPARIEGQLDLVEVTGLVAGNRLHLMIQVEGELDEDVVVGLYLDHGEGSLARTQVFLWPSPGGVRAFVNRWSGPAIESGYERAEGLSWAEYASSGSMAELALPGHDPGFGQGPWNRRQSW